MMNKSAIIERLAELNLDPEEYWLITGAAMVLYGFKETTGDIDLGCTSRLADELEARGCPVAVMADQTRRIDLMEDVEIFEDWLEDRVIQYEGIPVVSIKGLIQMKKKLGREKDLKDIVLIENRCNMAFEGGQTDGNQLGNQD